MASHHLLSDRPLFTFPPFGCLISAGLSELNCNSHNKWNNLNHQHYYFSKEKWESSGASRAVSDVYAQVPQGTKDYFTSTSQQLFNRQHLRPFAVVFGIGEERPFYVEKSPALLMERIRHNFSFFYMNYMVLTAILFTLTLLVTPSAIIGIGGLGFAWVYMIRSSTNGHIRIGSKFDFGALSVSANFGTC